MLHLVHHSLLQPARETIPPAARYVLIVTARADPTLRGQTLPDGVKPTGAAERMQLLFLGLTRPMVGVTTRNPETPNF